MTGLKPFHHFFLTTLIHRKSFVVTRHVFGLKISHMRLLIAFTSPQAGGEVEWKGWDERGEKEKGRSIPNFVKVSTAEI